MKYIFVLIIITIAGRTNGQNIIQSENWFDFNSGKYELKSLSPSFRIKTNLIEPQISIKSINDQTSFLVPPKDGIVLFKNNKPASIEDVSGILFSSTLIELIEIDYRKTFQHPDTAYVFTHEVWYGFLLNNELYYTDYRVHNVELIKELQQLNQVASIAYQNTGYDNYYDNGYPENFQFLTFDQVDNTDLKLNYDSGQLEFECNCEFWGPDTGTISWVENSDGSLTIQLNGIQDNYTVTWNGEELKK